jgi:hypothetical protein
MWTEEQRRLYQREGEGHPSDLRDAEWARLEPLIPKASPGKGLRRPAAPLGGRAHLLLVLTKPASRQGFREPCRNPGHLRDPRIHPACPQAACQGVGLELKKPTGWQYKQYTVRKVRKWDGEGGLRRNARQRRGCADSRPSRLGPGTGIRPQPSFAGAGHRDPQRTRAPTSTAIHKWK